MRVIKNFLNCDRYCIGLADVGEDFTAAVGHKNPKLKSEAIKLLQVCLRHCRRATRATCLPFNSLTHALNPMACSR